MKIKETVLVINGAPLEGVNPLPKFRDRAPAKPNTDEEFPDTHKEGLGYYYTVLPYLVQDRYSRKRVPLRLKCMTLENEYLKAEFLPEYGGRLYSLYDKEREIDLVMKNPVIQPANLAIRNAWLSGGIEWNIGSMGHTFTTCDNVFCAKLDDGEGNEFLRIYEYERLKGLFWQVDFHLPDGSRELFVHVKMMNPQEEARTTYWWSNTAVPDEGKTRILASEESIISFVGGKMKLESLPYIDAMPGADVSYPREATRSFDFFIQTDSEAPCTWESAVYEGGAALFERSTPPLCYKKLFCWGNHRAGKHWQEFLSDEGSGFYAEIQAGIAPSQLHEKLIGAKSCYEWTQCFGGISGDEKALFDPDYRKAKTYLGELIDKRITKEGILEANARFAKLAEIAVTEGDLVHLGSGFGAVEIKRMKLADEGEPPKSLCFPDFTVGKNETPWLYLVENGVLPNEDPRYFTPTYNTSAKWRRLIEESLEKEGGKTWYSLAQLGVAVYDGVDVSRYSHLAYSEEDQQERTRLAEIAWLESARLAPNLLAYRNLARLEADRKRVAEAEYYYDLAIATEGAFDDFALCAEYFGFLLSLNKYDKIWQIFTALPDNCKKADRVRIYVAGAAVKLNEFDYLEEFFREEHYDIREGECSLTNVWFEYNARRLAKERGIEPTKENLNELLEEAERTCPPDPLIDFRMSLDKSKQYRIQ